jgi:small subunit ribosomal protein S6
LSAVSAVSPTYDLVLLLDPQAESQTREKIVTDVRAMIAGDGEVVHEDSWGERALAYPIEKKKSADYHLLQFHAGSGALLDELGRTLRITDGVVRFRVIKLREGVGAPPQMPSAEPSRETAAAPEAPEAAAPAAPEAPESPSEEIPAAAANEQPAEAEQPADAEQPAEAEQPAAAEPADA